ncbi:MAG: protein Xni [Parasphingorhabdus sp.]
MNFLLVDGLNLIRRVYAGVPKQPDEDPMSGVAAACVASLNKAIRRQNPTHAVCVMDSPPPSWRHLEFPAYKENRPPMPEPLQDGLESILQGFTDRGVSNIQIPGYEADDVIAAIAVKIAEVGGQVTIQSTDKSLCQVLRTGIRVYDHFSDRYLDREFVKDRFDIEPEQLALLQALVGETSLNVPGVHGIGKKTAAKLIHNYNSLPNILSAADTMSGNIGVKLRAGIPAAHQAIRLLTLKTDIELGLNLKAFRMG